MRPWCFLGASRQIVHQVSDPGVQRLPGGGSGDFPFSQRRRGKISLLFGAESAGLEHQTLPPVQSVHLSEGAQPQPLRTQVQGKVTVLGYAPPTVYSNIVTDVCFFCPSCRSSVAIASLCGALNATRRGITGSNVGTTERETSCYETGLVS